MSKNDTAYKRKIRGIDFYLLKECDSALEALHLRDEQKQRGYKARVYVELKHGVYKHVVYANHQNKSHD